MPPTNPCNGCKDEGYCPTAGQVCRIALNEWIEDRFFECPDYRMKTFRGLEGVRP